MSRKISIHPTNAINPQPIDAPCLLPLNLKLE